MHLEADAVVVNRLQMDSPFTNFDDARSTFDGTYAEITNTLCQVIVIDALKEASVSSSIYELILYPINTRFSRSILADYILRTTRVMARLLCLPPETAEPTTLFPHLRLPLNATQII